MKITKKQNVILDGMKYVAKGPGACTSCAFDNKGMCDPMPCVPSMRKDSKDVHFVLKGPVKPKNKWIAINGVIPQLDPQQKIEWRNSHLRSNTQAGTLNWSIGQPGEITHYRPWKPKELA